MKDRVPKQAPGLQGLKLRQTRTQAPEHRARSAETGVESPRTASLCPLIRPQILNHPFGWRER